MLVTKELDFDQEFQNALRVIYEATIADPDLQNMLGVMDEEMAAMENKFDVEQHPETLKPFERLNEEYALLYEEYSNSFEELSKKVSEKAYRYEYSKGGLTIHRGFYSPSLADLVTGNCSRGRLLRQKPKGNTCDFEYVFDARNNLICVNKFSGEFDNEFKLVSTELFVQDKNAALALEFDIASYDISLSRISKCRYDGGKPMGYESASYMACGECNCTGIHVESFEYVNALLYSFCASDYAPSINLLSQHKYTFSRDQEGYLSTYIVEALDGEKFRQLQFKGEPSVYKVLRKRK